MSLPDSNLDQAANLGAIARKGHSKSNDWGQKARIPSRVTSFTRLYITETSARRHSVKSHSISGISERASYHVEIALKAYRQCLYDFRLVLEREEAWPPPTTKTVLFVGRIVGLDT